MYIKEFKPGKALNKAFLKVKPNRAEIERFKTNLIQLLDRTNETEYEEFHKNLVSDFLKKTYYDPEYFINTKGRNDLVIHNGNNARTTVGVIIEAKSPANKSEMVTTEKLNTKAFHEIILYYLRERILHKNIEIKQLVITNINEWFVFDAVLFDRLFAQNKNLVKQFNDFESGRLADTTTDFFYRQIAEPFINGIQQEVEFAYFDIRNYQKQLRNNNKEDDKKLIALFKLLSPEHLLKLPFVNDSNSLDKRFYTELLYIIGLSESKEGSKKLIARNKEGERNSGAILEDAIIQLDSLDKINRLDKPAHFGGTKEERLFNVALELSITWINRILFLKLLEAQLISYHKDYTSYSFLNSKKIKSYDDLNNLFFQVLARKFDERNDDVKKAFEKVPYLNSSLFEPTDIEQLTLFISNLKDDKTIPVISSTVLKDEHGKKLPGRLTTLDYLFRFLDAYDFSGERGGDIQENNKTLINASVLGLIFEKINGYKDGSYFTPGFITMYMCRETIRKAVAQKFNDYCLNHDLKEIKIEGIEEAFDLIPKHISRKKANEIVNSIKICDPAVGSGHFLVSALNEIISIKNDLKILEDKEGRSLSRYEIQVENDELAITDEDGELFQYRPGNKESRRVQETLFHEKETIIENCLFGVDINSNSVKICRLRLWIELLKNAYYKTDEALETLPNIDINIKCGNSLVSRFAIDADLKEVLKKIKFNINGYRVAVETYRNAENKEQKREMEKLIAAIKNDFTSEIETPFKKNLREARGKSETLATKILNLKTFGEKIDKKLFSDHAKAVERLKKLEDERDNTLNNKVFENAFEWRFEFPEVLNDDGDFIGFDVVIGNPPYIPLEAFSLSERRFFNNKYPQLERKYESSVPFILEGLTLLNQKGLLAYIAPVTWQTGENYSKFRQYLVKNFGLEKIINLPFNIFEDAYVDTALYFITKPKQQGYSVFAFDKKAKVENLEDLKFEDFKIAALGEPDFKLFTDKSVQRFSRFKNNNNFIELGSITKSTQGLSGSKFAEINNPTHSATVFPFLAKGNVYNYCLLKEKIYSTDLAGKRNLIQFYEAEPKILIRRIINRQDRLSVTYCNEKLVFKKDINPFIPTDSKFNCLFLTGIIASKFISFLYLNSSSIATKDDFRQTTLTELRKLPIPNVGLEKQNEISDLVLQILEIKKIKCNEDAADLEGQIDQLAYQLYGLTEEEVAIVENGSK